MKNTYKSVYISLSFQSNIYITKMYGTMNIKFDIDIVGVAMSHGFEYIPANTATLGSMVTKTTALQSNQASCLKLLHIGSRYLFCSLPY
jgi:hypothetical protein